jgi:hypothetical protein
MKGEKTFLSLQNYDVFLACILFSFSVNQDTDITQQIFMFP